MIFTLYGLLTSLDSLVAVMKVFILRTRNQTVTALQESKNYMISRDQQQYESWPFFFGCVCVEERERRGGGSRTLKLCVLDQK